MIFVDTLTEYGPEMTKGLKYKTWCHMVSDTSEAELHEFAAKLGLKREWAQLRPKASAAHYDLVPAKRALAIKLGAVAVTSRELVLRNFDGLTMRRKMLAFDAALESTIGGLDETPAMDEWGAER